MKHGIVFFLAVFCAPAFAHADLLPPANPRPATNYVTTLAAPGTRVASAPTVHLGAPTISTTPTPTPTPSPALTPSPTVTTLAVPPDEPMISVHPNPPEPTTNNDQALIDQYNERLALRDKLRQQQNQIRSEKDRCAKARNNWRTATIIGGIGTVVGTVGAIVQHNKIEDKKDQIKQLQSEIDNAKAGLDADGDPME